MSKPKSQKKVRPPRDMEVPAMRGRGGKGPHKDHRKEEAKTKCRDKVEPGDENP